MITLHSNGTIDGLANGAIETTKLADTTGAGAAVGTGGALNIGGIRIQYGTTTTGAGSNHGNASTYGYSWLRRKNKERIWRRCQPNRGNRRRPVRSRYALYGEISRRVV